EVNCAKENRELILNDKIDKQGYDISIDGTVEGGLVDVVVEGNTLVNVSKTKELTPVTCKYDTIYGNCGKLIPSHGVQSQLEQIVLKDKEQDTRLNNVEYVNKRQDVVMSGLLNEGGDGRLSIEGEGNSVKLEHSKDGVCEVGKVVGNTLVNLFSNLDMSLAGGFTAISNSKFKRTAKGMEYGTILVPVSEKNKFTSNGRYVIIANVTKNTLIESGGTQAAFMLPTYNYSNSAIENSSEGFYSLRFSIGEVGTKICTVRMKDFNNPSYPINYGMKFESSFYATSGELEVEITMIPVDESYSPVILSHFEGMQSSFEDCQVTQAMIDNGEEKVENLGKYKATVSVTGKNLFDKNSTDIMVNTLLKEDGTLIGYDGYNVTGYIKVYK
ncbi:MAG: hypothetical protein ACRDDY_18935, partial [Clostridium sp.]|uniref:hypothetical protein n=1 Tax=Clostridium sp. TaxID=1506 RepID=UPI003EE56E42